MSINIREILHVDSPVIEYGGEMAILKFEEWSWNKIMKR